MDRKTTYERGKIMGQNRIVRGRATAVKTGPGDLLEVIYHNTTVVTRKNGVVTLRTGGWRSATTLQRMRQAANQFSLGYLVYQKDFNWYVNYKGATLAFNGDEITLPA
jgi:exopolysaccharide biosynthesis protein